MFENGMTSLKQGKILGERLSSGVMAFRGVPYARPPLGNLRWRPAQPVRPWTTVLDCTWYAANATQIVLPMDSFYQKEFYPTTRRMSEDGLYLNVWTPAKSAEDGLPIYVWIHGGAFTEGAGSALQFIGEKLASRGVVVATINYRLGAFGFMAHPELTAEQGHSGNYGFTDMAMALSFLKENAKAFGGNPENITIDGQSAGSMSVCALVASPKAKGLFQKAIAQSGSVFGRRGILDAPGAEEAGLQLQKALGCKNIQEMRLVPPEEIMETVAKEGLFFRPSVDGSFIQQPYAKIYEEGLHNQVTMLVGSTAAEGCLHEVEPDDLAKHLRLPQELGVEAEDFLKAFPASTNEEAAKQSDVLRTSTTFAGMKGLADSQKKAGRKAYLYTFDMRLPDGDGKEIGPFHSAELVYQFGTLDTGWRPWRPEDYALSERMMDYWAAFCKTGDPNAPGLPRWEPYADDGRCMHLGKALGMGEYPYAEQVAYMEAQM